MYHMVFTEFAVTSTHSPGDRDSDIADTPGLEDMF
jgi:hypothetical protein